MKKFLIALAGLTCLTAPSVANAGATITFTTANPIPVNNDYKADLNGLGLTQFTTTGATITLDPGQQITFWFVGAESGFSDTFSTAGLAPNVSYTEGFNNLEPFQMTLIGTDPNLPTGIDLAGFLNFTSSGPGMPGTVGTDPFAIFLGPNAVSGMNVTEFFFGYDDQINQQDDNHDDIIIRALVTGVPEPATWGMMLLGFAGIGMALRRQRKPALAQIA